MSVSLDSSYLKVCRPSNPVTPLNVVILSEAKDPYYRHKVLGK